ncbi:MULTISPECIES: SDR family oxidoreductase [Sphingomonadales]|uniref:SDR family oxidoreductase n=1 Tax=Sphingopyxis fribergensis TaxID=1515612 RepID=A0A0A7PAR2_9SPHN|nr:SDR family NAD(P)-dependent oxidoreductase [Sphingopyxis fribergensis]AJA07156.1 hypothetical protein SKP52_01070 [Sphingopyxis fribergensis]MDF0546174.1 SDR family oxidoreductase [Sphingobium arseniciresistens]
MFGTPNVGTYGAAKHTAVGLTKTAAGANANMNIRINAIEPPAITTPTVVDLAK